MVLSEDFHGYGWPGYAINAWSAFHRVDAGYDAFRQPLHGWLLGALGEGIGSYPYAAVILSSVSLGAMVLAAGLIAGQLGGPWAGGLAAVSLAMVSHNAQASRAANHYPLQSGLSALAVAASLIAARRGSVALSALSGLLSGLAVAVDGRMIFYALIAGAMQLVRGRLAPVLAFVALVWVGPVAGARLVLPEQPMMSTAQVMTLQRPVILRWAQQSNDPVLMAACAHEDADARPSLAGLQTPCARAMWSYNVTRVFPSHFPLGVPLTAAAALAALLGWALARKWRDGLLGAMWLVGSGAPLLLQSLWVPQPDRYLLPWAVPLATAVPIALGRLPRRWMVAAAAVGVGLWAWQADPTGRYERLQHELNRNYAQRREARWIAEAHIGGAPLLDCSGLYIGVSMLPRITSPMPPQLKVNPRRCRAWVAAPPEPGSWVATDPRTGTYRDALQASGWQRVYSSDFLALWQAPSP